MKPGPARRLLLVGAAGLALAGVARAASPASDEVGFFSKQRVLERLGETSDIAADQRDAVTPAASVATSADIERRVKLAGDGADDPLSPAEVEGALDAAFAPLVPPMVPPATRAAPAPTGSPRERCAALHSTPDRGWGLLGRLDGQVFTWVDGVGKLRTVVYRTASDGRAITVSISIGGGLRQVERYVRTGQGVARVESSAAGHGGVLRLTPDSFRFEAAHEAGVYRLDARCDLVLDGALRQTGRRISDVLFNTTGDADGAQEEVIRDRAATRIARLRKSAIVGLARHS